MSNKELISNCGFIEDVNNNKLKEVMKDGVKLKNINMDLYLLQDNPFMLLSRVIEKNVFVSNNGVNFIIKKTGKYSTYLVNILFTEIKNTVYKKFYDGCYEFIFDIKNVQFKLTIIV